LTKWWSYAAPKFGRHYYASQESSDLGGGELSNNTSGWSEMNKQILFNRQYDTNNAPGTIFYSAAYINGHKADGFGDYLKANAFAYKSLTPVVTWKTGSTYGKVTNAAYNNGTLSWTETTNGNAIIRYTVYAMPMSVTINQAKASDGDGFAVEYLQDVVYGGTYTVDTDKRSNYWYAVCVYDGYGREHEAAIVGYPDGDSQKTTLISPINGAAVQWSQEFSWSAVSSATYVLEIADNSSFSTIRIQKTGLTANKATVDLGALNSKTTYYWRVRTTQSGKLESVSDVATFVTTTRPSAPKTSLLSPADGAEIDDSFAFTWSAVSCDKYTLQVATQRDFSTIKYEKTVAETSHAMKLSMLGKGTFYWRVITSGSGLENTVSDVRSFNIAKVDVGNFEPGYEVLIDKANDSYSDQGTVTVNNIWFRSVLDDYQNITFAENGSLNRSFCAVGDYVYVASRSENSTSANIYLRKYDGKTGEHPQLSEKVVHLTDYTETTNELDVVFVTCGACDYEHLYYKCGKGWWDDENKYEVRISCGGGDAYSLEHPEYQTIRRDFVYGDDGYVKQFTLYWWYNGSRYSQVINCDYESPVFCSIMRHRKRFNLKVT
jgi:hypothetical protein